MIKIKVSNDVITISGHAMYDDFGKDIVCAAVSSTVITTVNAILSIDKDAIKVDEKDGVRIDILKHNEIVDKLILNMINLLTELQKDYKDNIDIRRC
jgi:uncharacterized protein YsxB (DUF464 family)